MICKCKDKFKDLEKKLDKHEKQHTIEHYLVMLGLGVIVALLIVPYVI